MSFRLFIVFLFLLHHAVGVMAQKSCTAIYNDAVELLAQKDVKGAFVNYTDASACDFKEKQLDKKLEKLLNDIFTELDRQKEAEVKARSEAEEAKRTAEELAQKEKIANEETQKALDQLRRVTEEKDKVNVEQVKLLLQRAEDNIALAQFDAALENVKTARIVNAIPDEVDVVFDKIYRSILISAHADVDQRQFERAFLKLEQADSMYYQPAAVIDEYSFLQNQLLQNIHSDLNAFNYTGAVAKTHLYTRLNTPRDSVARLFFEEAFCLSELGMPERTLGLMDTLSTLFEKEEERAQLASLASQSPYEQLIALRAMRSRMAPELEAAMFDQFMPKRLLTIPGGKLKGNAPSDGANTRGNACSANVSTFLMASKEVTFFEYDFYCTANGLPRPSDNGWGRQTHPVVDVNWYDAIAFCNWRSHQEGLQEVYLTTYGTDSTAADYRKITCDWTANGYRLPTEAEWEYAAGNGEAHTLYSWGNDIPMESHGGNVADQTAQDKYASWTTFDYADAFAYTAPVGSFKPNQLGLHDMSGNVWEWCWNTHDDDFCRALKHNTADNKHSDGTQRILRGGSWSSYPKDCEVNRRYHRSPEDQNYSIGFRLARNY
ncbi:MAG: SUMF1/EgtB/PvdO family nonheme iron enzyme [Saprospiraceae bacterium]